MSLGATRGGRGCVEHLGRKDRESALECLSGSHPGAPTVARKVKALVDCLAIRSVCPEERFR
eukprot:7391640-Prymnesium_polylepis.2